MKQALIDSDGMTVVAVRLMPTDEQGAVIQLEGDTYAGPILMLADDHYCGPGMLWDGETAAPLFTYPTDLAAESAGAWSKLKAFFFGS